MTDIHYKETQYGFEYGAACIERASSDDKTGAVYLLLKTKKYKRPIQIYIAKTGKVRVFGDGEWIKPEKGK